MSSAWISLVFITIFLSALHFPRIACDDLRFNEEGQGSLVYTVTTKNGVYIRPLISWLSRGAQRIRKKEDSAVGKNLMHSVNLLDRIMKWERASRKFERMRSGGDFHHMDELY